MTRSRVCPLDVALAGVADGMHIGLGGILGRRRPISACAALAAAGRTGLNVYSFLAGLETEVLVASGCVASVTSAYLDPAAQAQCTKRAIADQTLHWREVSEHIFVGGLLAAANGLPFWPTLGAVGSDLVADLGLREVRCPYTDRPVIAVPATPLDVSLIHAAAATASGVVSSPQEREFLDDADIALARAARRVVVTVDRLAADDEPASGWHSMLAPFEIDAVVVVDTDGAGGAACGR